MNVLKARLASPVDLGNGDRLGEDVLEQLTGYGTGAGLLDLCQRQVEGGVEEIEQLLLADEVGGVHHADGCVGVASAHGGGSAGRWKWRGGSGVNRKANRKSIEQRHAIAWEVINTADQQATATDTSCALVDGFGPWTTLHCGSSRY